MADPQRSVSVIMQLVGRPTRKDPNNPDKKCGLILIPVAVDPARAAQWAAGEEAEEQALSVVDREFSPVVSVLKALAASDDVVGSALSAARQDAGEQRGNDADHAPVHEIPMFGCFWAGHLRHDIDSQRLWNVVQTKLVRLASDPWEERLRELVEYKRSHNGSTAVPRGWAENTRLASWVNAQRDRKRGGCLPARLEAQLAAVDFCFSPQQEDFDRNLEWLYLWPQVVP